MYSRIPQLKCRLRAASLKFGSISQNRSKAFAKIIHWQTRISRFLLRLMSRESSSENGISQWKDEIKRDDDAPVPANAIEIPGNLFRQVARPDDQELPEGEIDIQHDKGEGELAQVVLLCLAQQRF